MNYNCSVVVSFLVGKKSHVESLINVHVTSSNVLTKVSLQTKLNAGLSEQQQEDLFLSERSFHEVKL